MGTKRVGLARTQALLENLKREVNLSTSTTLKGMNLSVAATTGAAGAGLTGDSSTSPQVFVQTIGGEIVTTVLLDLDGLVKESTVGDVIGADSSAAAYLFRYVEATHGVPYKLEMSCIVLPTGTNPQCCVSLCSSRKLCKGANDPKSCCRTRHEPICLPC